jgi:hypothetical protein
VAYYCHHAWHDLVGLVVEVRREGAVVREGLVDAAMADSSALWIAADGFQDRVLIEAAEGYEVWLEPRRLDGKSAYRLAQSWRAPRRPGMASSLVGK